MVEEGPEAIRVAHVNCCGLLRQVDETLQALMHLDILMLSETHLTTAIERASLPANILLASPDGPRANRTGVAIAFNPATVEPTRTKS